MDVSDLMLPSLMDIDKPTNFDLDLSVDAGWNNNDLDIQLPKRKNP